MMNDTIPTSIVDLLPWQKHKNGYLECLIGQHRFVWIFNYGPIPPGYIIHHIDGDRSNNVLPNLELKEIKEHAAYHNKIREGNEETLAKSHLLQTYSMTHPPYLIDMLDWYQGRDKYVICLIKQHRLVWIVNHGPIPEGYIIHHKDGNRANNTITNLELTTPSQHSRNHQHKIFVDGDKVRAAGRAIQINKSIYINIPKAFAEMMGIDKGDYLPMKYDGKRTITFIGPDKRKKVRRFEVRRLGDR